MGTRGDPADVGAKEIAGRLRGGGKPDSYWARVSPIAWQHHSEPLWYRSFEVAAAGGPVAGRRRIFGQRR